MSADNESPRGASGLGSCETPHKCSLPVCSGRERRESEVLANSNRKRIQIKADINKLREEFDREIQSGIDVGIGLVRGFFTTLKLRREDAHDALMAIAIPHIWLGAYIAKIHPELVEINEVAAPRETGEEQPQTPRLYV